MKKEQLLKTAQACGSASEAALELGAQVTTAESAAAAVETATTTYARTRKLLAIWGPVFKWSGFTSAISFMIALFTNGAPNSAVPYWPIYLAGAALGLSVLSSYTVDKAEREKAKARHTLDNAKPIAGTTMCEEALEYLKSQRTEVVAWRDLAIAERGQLYAFDVEVMRCIDKHLANIDVAAKNLALNEAAFLKVHNLARPEGSPAIA